MVLLHILHNQVIKRAVYDQVGYVLEQEGDSFTVSFYEPEDAVAFTLQVRELHNEETTQWTSQCEVHLVAVWLVFL